MYLYRYAPFLSRVYKKIYPDEDGSNIQITFLTHTRERNGAYPCNLLISLPSPLPMKGGDNPCITVQIPAWITFSHRVRWQTMGFRGVRQQAALHR